MENQDRTMNSMNIKEEETKKLRRPYHPPHLEVLGDLRSLTLGGSIGIGDSGAGSGTELPGPGH